MKFDEENFEKVISSGDGDAMVALYEKFYKETNEGDFSQFFTYNEYALKLLEKAVELGNVKAMLKLGHIYEYGNDYVGKNPGKAFDFYKKAADKGNGEAMVNIAGLYTSGYDFEQDFKEGLYWINQAIKINYPHAYYLKGMMYLKGQGLPQSDEKYFSYMEKAKELGDEDAMVELDPSRYF